MMSLMSPLTIPADLPVTLETLQNLVSLLANPDATKQRITEMQTATATLQQAIDEQKTQMAAFAVAEASHQEAINAATDEHAAKLAADQAAFNSECARRKSELDARDAELSQLQARAQADAEAAEVLRADLEARLAHIKAAAA
jgi:chromosome segregation ATPase